MQQQAAPSRAEALRTITYLMAFRVALASLLLIGVAASLFNLEGPEIFARPFTWIGFGLLGFTYLLTIVYVLAMPRVRDPATFTFVQVAVDLLLISVVVHITGGAQSSFTFLFMIEVIAVVLLPARHGVLTIALASAILLVATAFLGYLRILPTAPGQLVLPSDIGLGELFSRLVLNLAAIAAVAALGLNLAGQTRQAGEKLARHQEYAGDLASLHENTIRSLSSGLVTVSLDGLVTSINEAARDILGLAANEGLGQPITHWIPRLGPVLAEVGLVGSVKRHEVEAVRPDRQTRHLGVSATPLSDHTGRIIGRVIHFQDLTELRRMQREVERAERLASIGRLAAGVAHEIRNPLAAISGSVEMLKDFPGADTDTKQLIDIVVREVDRLNRLITELLDYARPKTEEHSAIDLSELVAEIGKAFGIERRSRRATELDLKAELQRGVGIEGAAGQIRQVIWNLVRNAADAMPKGGTLTLSVSLVENAGRAQAELVVRDTGVGMSKENLDRIFEPFFSTKAGGTGLGLATVARIIEDHKARIEVDSTLGQGTVFRLVFAAIPVPERTPTSVNHQPHKTALA